MFSNSEKDNLLVRKGMKNKIDTIVMYLINILITLKNVLIFSVERRQLRGGMTELIRWKEIRKENISPLVVT